MHIVPYPLLNKCCEERGEKTEDQAHEPENVDSDIGWVWNKSREWWKRSRWDRNMWGDGGNLLGDLSEKCNNLLLVVDHLLCWVDLKTISAICKK